MFQMLNVNYGLVVETCILSTSVWSYALLSRIPVMLGFYKYCKSVHPELSYDFEPELFPCMTICKFAHKSVMLRVFYTGKVIILGVRHVSEIVEPLLIVTNMFFDYCK
jgi:TATA-box binding protein (TBP) (component of TFIID and TFIIIB)